MNIHWKGTIDAAHFLPGHPKCGRLHGHTYHIEVDIAGELPNTHPMFLLDYAAIKNVVHQLDHRLIVPEKHKFIEIGQSQEVDPARQFVGIRWPDGQIMLRPDAICVLPIRESSSECLAQFLAAAFAGLNPNFFVTVTVAETPSTTATACAGTRAPFLNPPVEGNS